MNKLLVASDIKSIEERLKRFEQETGCELLMIIQDASDPYPAASLRFGLISTFILTSIFAYYYEYQHALLWPVTFIILTFIMSWIGHFDWAKRMALASWEVERECEEKALELFHTMGTSQVSHKVTAMIFLSILEHHIEVLIDEKLKSKLSQKDLDELVVIMKQHFASGHMSEGLIQSIESLENKILQDFGGKVSDVNPAELKDTIHFLSLK
jgi:uncharacterized membrane protein